MKKSLAILFLVTTMTAHAQQKYADSLKKVVKTYRTLLKEGNAAKYKVNIIDACNSIARFYIKKGEPDSAVYYAKKVIALKPENTYPFGMLETAAILVNIYEKEHTPDSAYKYLKLSISIQGSLLGRQNKTESRNAAVNGRLNRPELEKQQPKTANLLKTYGLAALILFILVIAFLLWRNNRYRRQAKTLLQQQKKEIEFTTEQLHLTQRQLIQSEKMASLGELTAGIAHEIQNPLNFVNNFSDVNMELISEMKTELKNGTKEEVIEILEDIKQNLEKISHHGRRAESIVKGMLQHSRASSNIKEPTDINNLADEYLRLAYHGLRAKDKTFNSELIVNFSNNIPVLNVVPQDIGRVMLNMFTNAFYAVNQKQKTTGANYQPTVTLSTTVYKNQVVIAVKDNGNGIPANIKDKIMQPFFTTKPTGEGTGLGLSMSYDIVVKGHNGSIDVNTKEGEFSEFIIKLPT